MGRIQPLDLMENNIRDEMVLVDDDRAVISLGGSHGLTIPPAVITNEDLEHNDEMECHYDPATGAIVFLPADQDHDDER